MEELVIDEILPADVAATLIRLDELAATCDWDGLADAMGPDFLNNFGGIDPIEVLNDNRRSEEQFTGTPMLDLRRLFRQPVGTTEYENVVHYIWPAVFTRDSCAEITDNDRAQLEVLGYSLSLIHI